jgi:hypothetical protein
VIPRDKLLHLGLGVLWLCATAVNLLVYTFFGLGPALAYGTTAFGILYEVNQWIRKEGQPDPWDAAVTAAPGFVAWSLLELMA